MSNITSVIAKYQYAVLNRNVFRFFLILSIELAYLIDSCKAFHTFAAAPLKYLSPNLVFEASCLISYFDDAPRMSNELDKQMVMCMYAWSVALGSVFSFYNPNGTQRHLIPIRRWIFALMHNGIRSICMVSA